MGLGGSVGFNGARSFLLLELAMRMGVVKGGLQLQWGQEFFTPGIDFRTMVANEFIAASMGPGVFYSWNRAELLLNQMAHSPLQWGQEFFTPGMDNFQWRGGKTLEASMGPGVFYSWNRR